MYDQLYNLLNNEHIISEQQSSFRSLPSGTAYPVTLESLIELIDLSVFSIVISIRFISSKCSRTSTKGHLLK